MAVFTPVTDDDARGFLTAYDIGELRHLEGIEEGVSNTNFKVETSTGLYALTLFEAATPQDSLPWFMDYTLYLDRKGYPAPGPALMRSGESLGRINGKWAALIKWLPGRWPRNPDTRHAASAGEWLARLHLTGGDFPQVRANSMGPQAWPHLIARCEPKGRNLAARARHPGRFSRRTGFPRRQMADRPAYGGNPRRLFHRQCADERRSRSHRRHRLLLRLHGRLCLRPGRGAECLGLHAGGPGHARHDQGLRPRLPCRPSPVRRRNRPPLPLFARGSAVRFTLTRLYDLLNHDPSWVVKPKDPEAFYRRLNYHRNIVSGLDYF